jgi:hypothetical protein
MSEKELQEAEYFASLLLSDAELETLLELPDRAVERALDTPGDALARAIRAGRLKTKCVLHASLITTARRHSTPAQQMVADLLKRIDNQ